ncbi:unnamed protein product [Meloidogyne enterolobii]|uniref:Uncharacterized protein n=1 Tax=Meloidogyne enterolobii TaxID=390850 RepID=A0ACB0ZZB6_MELEN
MVSANDTNEHRSATPLKGSPKQSGYSKRSQFQTTHSMEFGSNQLVDSNREKNHKKHYSVDGKLLDTVTTTGSSEQINSGMDFDKNSNFNHKNPEKAGNSCNGPKSKLCRPDQNTSENNQMVSTNYYGNENEYTMSTHSSEQNICRNEFVPKRIGIPCLKGLITK